MRFGRVFLVGVVLALLALMSMPLSGCAKRVNAEPSNAHEVVKANQSFTSGLRGLEQNYSLETNEDDPSLALAIESLTRLWELRDYPGANPKSALKAFLLQLDQENIHYSSMQKVNEVCVLMGEVPPYPTRPQAFTSSNQTRQFLDNWYEVEKWAEGGTWDSQYLYCDEPLVQTSFDAFQGLIDRGYPRDKLRRFYKVRIYRYWKEAVYMNSFDPKNKVHLATESQIKGFAKALDLPYKRPVSCTDQLRKIRKEQGLDY